MINIILTMLYCQYDINHMILFLFSRMLQINKPKFQKPFIINNNYMALLEGVHIEKTFYKVFREITVYYFKLLKNRRIRGNVKKWPFFRNDFWKGHDFFFTLIFFSWTNCIKLNIFTNRLIFREKKMKTFFIFSHIFLKTGVL